MRYSWYALAVHSRKEDYVERQLRADGFTTVCPRYRSTVRHARQTKQISKPLFPGYLFVAMNLATDNWRLVSSKPGSIGIVKLGGCPSALSDCFVRNYIENADSDGHFSFCDELKPGDKVQAFGGPFHRKSGEVIAMSADDRVKILMDALNRKVEMTMPRRALVVAA